MNTFYQLAMASLLGLATTSSAMLGAAIGLYVPFSKRPLACLLAFAAGSLISALAIELAYESAQSLHHQGFNARAAWAFVSTGFAVGAVIYYAASLFLEKKGAAVRYVTQFREYALARKQPSGTGTVGAISGRQDSPDVWYNFTSPLTPSTVYVFNPSAGKSASFEAATPPVDTSGFETKAMFATSKDGTRVPFFLTAKKNLPLDGNNPTMLYGYGGFSVTHAARRTGRTCRRGSSAAACG